MSATREKVLILCRATPEESRQYTRTVCVAGITDSGEFRRIYPVPFRQFVPAGGIPFHKKQWIEADLSTLEGGHDHRKESRNIDLRTVTTAPKIEDPDVRAVILPLLSPSVAALSEADASLGIIKPDIVGYDIDIRSTDLTTNQLTLDPGDHGNRVGLVKLGQISRYSFNCPVRTGCSCTKQPHHIICLDWEVNELFRHIIEGGTTAPAQVGYKMRQKFLDWMREKRDTFFMLGTHNVYATWMIVSVIHLRPEAVTLSPTP